MAKINKYLVELQNGDDRYFWLQRAITSAIIDLQQTIQND
jgi:hypothetical protein